jgi:hypothetical protein
VSSGHEATGPAFQEFPEVIRASSADPAHEYRMLKTHFAVHTQPAKDGATGSIGEHITIYPKDRFSGLGIKPSDWSPVYSLAEGGTYAVPTGKVFVRLADGEKLADHADRVRAAGYAIDQILSYSPNAGWLRPEGSSIARGLAGLQVLAAIPGVVNVEPQMISKAARKE